MCGVYYGCFVVYIIIPTFARSFEHYTATTEKIIFKGLDNNNDSLADVIQSVLRREGLSNNEPTNIDFNTIHKNNKETNLVFNSMQKLRLGRDPKKFKVLIKKKRRQNRKKNPDSGLNTIKVIEIPNLVTDKLVTTTLVTDKPVTTSLVTYKPVTTTLVSDKPVTILVTDKPLMTTLTTSDAFWKYANEKDLHLEDKIKTETKDDKVTKETESDPSIPKSASIELKPITGSHKNYSKLPDSGATSTVSGGSHSDDRLIYPINVNNGKIQQKAQSKSTTGENIKTSQSATTDSKLTTETHEYPKKDVVNLNSSIFSGNLYFHDKFVYPRVLGDILTTTMKTFGIAANEKNSSDFINLENFTNLWAVTTTTPATTVELEDKTQNVEYDINVDLLDLEKSSHNDNNLDIGRLLGGEYPYPTKEEKSNFYVRSKEDSHVLAEDEHENQGLFRDLGVVPTTSSSLHSFRSESNPVGNASTVLRESAVVNPKTFDTPENYLDVIYKLLELLNQSLNNEKLDLSKVDFVLETIKKYLSPRAKEQISLLENHLTKEVMQTNKTDGRKAMVPPEEILDLTDENSTHSRPDTLFLQDIFFGKDVNHKMLRGYVKNIDENNPNAFRYELPKNTDVSCKEAFLNLIQQTQIAYLALANHLCSDSQKNNNIVQTFNSLIQNKQKIANPEIYAQTPLVFQQYLQKLRNPNNAQAPLTPYQFSESETNLPPNIPSLQNVDPNIFFQLLQQEVMKRNIASLIQQTHTPVNPHEQSPEFHPDPTLDYPTLSKDALARSHAAQMSLQEKNMRNNINNVEIPLVDQDKDLLRWYYQKLSNPALYPAQNNFSPAHKESQVPSYMYNLPINAQNRSPKPINALINPSYPRVQNIENGFNREYDLQKNPDASQSFRLGTLPFYDQNPPTSENALPPYDQKPPTLGDNPQNIQPISPQLPIPSNTSNSFAALIQQQGQNLAQLKFAPTNSSINEISDPFRPNSPNENLNLLSVSSQYPEPGNPMNLQNIQLHDPQIVVTQPLPNERFPVPNAKPSHINFLQQTNTGSIVPKPQRLDGVNQQIIDYPYKSEYVTLPNQGHSIPYRLNPQGLNPQQPSLHIHEEKKSLYLPFSDGHGHFIPNAQSPHKIQNPNTHILSPGNSPYSSANENYPPSNVMPNSNPFWKPSASRFSPNYNPLYAAKTAPQSIYEQRFLNPNNLVPHNLQPWGVTNTDKLNNLPKHSDIVELTYVINRPQPELYKSYYVKYRIPLVLFMHGIQRILFAKPYLRYRPGELYSTIAYLSDVAEMSPSLRNLPVNNLNTLVAQNGTLTNAHVMNLNSNFNGPMRSQDLRLDELIARVPANDITSPVIYKKIINPGFLPKVAAVNPMSLPARAQVVDPVPPIQDSSLTKDTRVYT